MGFRLVGEQIALSAPLELLSSAVSVGTIQLLPDGQLIVLMADHQTTGGYARIAHVISYDLPLVAQLGTNDKITFQLVDITEAEDLAIQFEKNLSFLRAACRFQTNS
jgi:antagonist of KipI